MVRAELGLARPLVLAGLAPKDGVAVDVGNPHLVRFGTADVASARERGPALSAHPAFPAGVNVGFAEVVADGALGLTVWERGSGLTAACGTGAAAAAAAAVHAGLVGEGEVRVRQAGGELKVLVGAADEHGARPVELIGPAVRVFSGCLDGEEPATR